MSSRTKSPAHRNFSLARFVPNEKQIRHIGARHQQHDSDGSEQRPQRAGDTPDDHFLQRQGSRHNAALIRRNLRKVRNQVGDLRA